MDTDGFTGHRWKQMDTLDTDGCRCIHWIQMDWLDTDGVKYQLKILFSSKIQLNIFLFYQSWLKRIHVANDPVWKGSGYFEIHCRGSGQMRITIVENSDCRGYELQGSRVWEYPYCIQGSKKLGCRGSRWYSFGLQPGDKVSGWQRRIRVEESIQVAEDPGSRLTEF